MTPHKIDLTKIRYLDGVRLKNAIIEASKVLENMKEKVDKINVFPIPDKDTGTNMSQTINPVSLENLISNNNSAGIISSELAEAALMGAQGYSGVILAQFFSGFAESIKDTLRLSTTTFANAVQKAKEKAYSALSNPTEGTILTVITDWANCIETKAKKTEDFTEILKTALQKAKISLAETPKKLDVLKKAGVVDAGALGFIHILEGIENFINNGKIIRHKSIPSIKDDKPIFADELLSSKVANKKVGIVTDSSCDLPEQFIKENPIHFIPLKLIFGEKTYLDKVEITPGEFYEKLVTSPVHPKTSQPAVADIKNVFERVLPLYEKIISIHVSGALSGTLQSIKMTAKMLGDKKDKITCIDGKNISGGLGLIIMEIIELINAKIPFAQIVEDTRKFVDNTHIFISLPTLKYLVKGGRVSKQKGIIGKILRLNPIISINKEGEIFPAGKALGNKAAMNKTLELIINKAKIYKRFKFGVAHINAPEKAEWFANKLKEEFNITEEIPKLEAAPVLGVHAGPGTAGIAFIGFKD